MRDLEIEDMPVRSSMFWDGYRDGLEGKHSGTMDRDYDRGFSSGKLAARGKRIHKGIFANTRGGKDWRTMREVEESRSLINWKDNTASRRGKRPQRHLDPDHELQRKSSANELRAAA